MVEKQRYSDTELIEFKELIIKKLESAKADYEMYKSAFTMSDSNDTSDTSPTLKSLEDSSGTISKEEAGKLAMRQQKFIQHLQAALVRIENKTYGICRKTNKLISKARLMAVPHATLSIEAKNEENR
ncbi:MAG: TraR/DksA family transcriptional regulator [Bacteroidales bacterium]